MKMQGQADLFLGFDVSVDRIEAKPIPKTRPKREADLPAFVLDSAHYEAAAQVLEGSGHYRILRRLVPRAICASCSPVDGEKIAIIIDTETTGLDYTRDEVIELGMVAFIYRADGQVGDVVGVFSALREPSVSISPEITRLTGITAEMVAGHAIDPDAVEQFIAQADLVIAHNARFDRPFCERLVKGFAHKAWACSHSEIGWSGLGFEGSKLGYLINQCGWFHQGHRAVDDCHALLEVLATPLPHGGGAPLCCLLTSARRSLIRIWAEGSPFDMKDVLRQRGYRWNDGSDGRPKSWWVEVEEAAYPEELTFLQKEVYRREVEPYVQKMTAFERFRAGR
jgi:DNA polymerase-3 subunit epsilon